MNQFKVGDVVQLKSGGPKMTVSEILDGGRVKCDWFEGFNAKWNSFPGDALELFQEKPTPRASSSGGGGGQWS